MQFQSQYYFYEDLCKSGNQTIDTTNITKETID